jgi:hypothetical protein
MERRIMSEPEIEPLVVSPKRTREMLNVGSTTVAKLVKTGVLDSVLIGRSRRILVASIRRLAEAGTNPEGAAMPSVIRRRR